MKTKKPAVSINFNVVRITDFELQFRIFCGSIEEILSE